MVSKSSDATSKSNKNETFPGLSSKINQLKKQIQVARAVSVKEKIELNGKNLCIHTTKLSEMALSKRENSFQQRDITSMLSIRMGCALYKIGGFNPGLLDKDTLICQEEGLHSTLVIGSSSGGKTPIHLIKLPYIEKIPPYTTWMFLNRNQRMAEDQSVVGRRQIYYDNCGSEALICSDSDEELAEPVEEKHDFSEGEDLILWNTIQEYGIFPEVLSMLTQSIPASGSDIEERYNALKHQNDHNKKEFELSKETGNQKLLLEKTLSEALDSFDNIFCRRCLVFDCRLHGCSQILVFPSEKQTPNCEVEDNVTPCSDLCFLQSKEKNPIHSSDLLAIGTFEETKEALDVDIKSASEHERENYILNNSENSLAGDEASLDTLNGEKRAIIDLVTASNPKSYDNKESCGGDMQNIISGFAVEKKPTERQDGVPASAHCWKPFEKELFLKGVEIFGKNSCLIARNMLSGLKSCLEVHKYMYNDGQTIPTRPPMLPNSSLDDNPRIESDVMDQEMPTRTKFLRRRGRNRKFKYTTKTTGHPLLRKRMADGKQQSCKQYTPCDCQLMCGKQCSCILNGTCCEKYCGCSKSCKNRFRGCHCAKSQCRSRQCPCFAAGRECDPDVCRNCWVSCGDGTLGEPPRRGDGYQCGNMKLLLKQQQRILLGRSDVAGWGAFIKNPVNKNDYLGEYTGELISHKEADKRGKIYDRANSSFLFDLNEQFVLDAFRKGDKLKFANHSSTPNCYAKVMLVAGDHRVGIFANEHIGASEEIFYDYRYGPDQAPAWAKKPDGSKRDDASVSHSRAKKIA